MPEKIDRIIPNKVSFFFPGRINLRQYYRGDRCITEVTVDRKAAKQIYDSLSTTLRKEIEDDLRKDVEKVEA